MASQFETSFNWTTMSLNLYYLIFSSYIFVCFSFKDKALFIVGGVSKIYLNQLPDSPLLDSFEVIGCSTNFANLPAYPKPIFGVRLWWLSIKSPVAWMGPNHRSRDPSILTPKKLKSVHLNQSLICYRL